MKMTRALKLGAVLVFFSTSSIAGFTCAVNKLTYAQMCFDDNKVRANGNVRSTPFYKGGPKEIDDTGFTARVHCVSKVIEMTDRKGIAFVRNVPTEQVGIDFVRFLCEHKKVKVDASLATN